MTYISNPANTIESTNNSSTDNVGGSTTLNGAINDSVTTITLTSGTNFPDSGAIKIEEEYISYTGKSTNDLTGCTRGAFDSTAASHSDTTAVIGVYIGTSEQNSRPDVMTSLKSDQTGTLYYDFSTNNTDWDTFPVSGFTVAVDIHEFHTAVKGSRYFRARYESSSSTITSSFRIYTYYGIFRQGNLPLNQSIGSDADSSIVRAVQTGEEPDGTYTNQKVSGYVIDTTSTLDNGETYDSGIVDVVGYSQAQNEIYADQDGVLTGTWYADSAGTVTVRTFTLSYDASTTDIIPNSFPVFTRYLRYQFQNNSGSNQTEFLFRLKLLTSAISGQIMGVEDTIVTNMVCNLQRSVATGKQPDGDYVNVPANGSAFSTSDTLIQTAVNDGTGIAADDTTITVDDTTGFSSSGFIAINDEIIEYSGTTATTFTGCTRGSASTTATTHDDNDIVKEVYSSSFTDTDGWNNIELFVATDQESLAKGIIIQFTDNTQAVTPTVRGTKKYTFNNRDVLRGFKLIKFAPLLDGYRVLYVDGDTQHTSFFLDTTLKVEVDNGAQEASPFESSVSGEFRSSTAEKKYILGQRVNYPVANVLHDICEFTITRPKGAGDNYRIYTPTTNTFGIEVVSDNANDSNAATDSDAGVKSVFVTYLDSAWVERTATANMNGTTAVTVVSSGVRRVNDMHSLTTGQWSVARGNITLRTTSGSTIESPWTGTQTLRYIAAGGNKDMTALYTVPLGKRVYLDGIYTSSATSDQSIRVRSNVNPTTRELIQANCFLFQSIMFIGTDLNNSSFASWLKFPQKADIKVSSKPTNTSADSSAHVVFMEIENDI